MLGVTEEFDGIYFVNSKTRISDIRDGTSHTIVYGERSDDIFDCTWFGVSEGDDFAGWRVLGWTGEPLNHPGSSEVHFHAFAQFNSMHAGGVGSFVFADGHTALISETIDADVFEALGSIASGEVIHGDY